MGFQFLKIPKEDRSTFYQDKYDFFKKVNLWAVIICCVGETAFFFTDCQINNHFATETLLPRFLILIPLAVFIFLYKRIKSYKIMVPLSYLMMHACMWCTIWAISFLDDKSHAQEGFIIMHLMFIGVGICAPIRMHIIFHSFLIINIAASYPINHYDRIELMLTLALPCVLGTMVFVYVFEKVFAVQQETQKQLEFLSVHDQLTGVYNRTKIKDICKPDSNELIFDKCGVILFDLDFFKNINDSYGHDAGDKVLESLSNKVLTCIRDDDYCIRWGGEEFLVLVPNQELVLVKEIAERIRLRIEKSEDFVQPITISAGVTIYSQGDYHDAVICADKALYFAKDSGRNMTIAYEDM